MPLAAAGYERKVYRGFGIRHEFRFSKFVKFVAKRPTVSPTWGFGIPDALVAGYGLDSVDISYTLPHIAALKREVYESR